MRGLFLAAGPAGLYGFHAGDGKQVWHHPVSGASGDWSAFPAGDHLFAACSDRLFGFSVPKA
ncbi:hypothetical protein ACFC1R_36905 [Kitasatospora sp. NPDC056138]|uniref:hypothetical protein n=1 Tax=Kitasatospora sp. NPDC056138 TaxID=3345724 RepID=UPI0035D7A75A